MFYGPLIQIFQGMDDNIEEKKAKYTHAYHVAGIFCRTENVLLVVYIYRE